MATTTSPADQIRAQLKANGYNRNHVSVRCSRGSAIYVTVNTHRVDIREVRNAADRHKRISRDHMTGEILCGGNLFVKVSYGRTAVLGFLAHNAQRIADLIAGADHGEGARSVEFDGFRAYITTASNGNHMLVISNGQESRYGHYLLYREHLAPEVIATELLDLRGR